MFVVKTKVLFSCAVTMLLNCAFGRFSHYAAQILNQLEAFSN